MSSQQEEEQQGSLAETVLSAQPSLMQECAQRSQEKRMPWGGGQKVPGSCWGWRMQASSVNRETEASRSRGKSPRELTEPRRGLCLDGAGGLCPHLGDLPQFTPLNPGSSLLPVLGSLRAFRISPNLTKQLFLVSELSCWRNNNCGVRNVFLTPISAAFPEWLQST